MKDLVSNVDQYIAQFPEQQQITLQKVRDVIRSVAPDATETISYGIPMYKKNGPVAAFGGFKHHCSYFPASYAVMKLVAEELKGYKVSKGTIQFPVNKPLPASLIRKMIHAKMKENETKMQLKKEIKSKAK